MHGQLENQSTYLGWDGPTWVLSAKLSQGNMLLVRRGGCLVMYHTGGEKGCSPMLWNDPDKLAPGGMRGEDTGTSYLKSVSCPERQFCPPDLRQPGFLAQVIPSLPFPSTGGGLLQDFLPCLILLPIYRHSFQVWTDVINGNKGFPVYKINTEMAEIVSWWQMEGTAPYT